MDAYLYESEYDADDLYFGDEDDWEEFNDELYLGDSLNESAPWLVNSEEELEGFRTLLNDRYRNVGVSMLDESLTDVYNSLSPAEEFNFGNVLKSVARAGNTIVSNPLIKQVGAATLPMAGAAAGTLFGGPIGTAVGNKIGQIAGQKLFGQNVPAMPTPAGNVAAGSTAAQQLLQLTQNPTVLRSLGSLAMGALGSKSVSTIGSGQTFNPASIINMLATLAQQASADAEELYGEDKSFYSDGESFSDPVNPEERAATLYAHLMNAENESLLYSY